MEVYENYMSTAKLVWEEFTGSSNQPKKEEKPEKKEKPKPSAIQPPKMAVCKMNSNKFVVRKEESKQILKPVKRRRPASAHPRRRENNLGMHF